MACHGSAARLCRACDLRSQSVLCNVPPDYLASLEALCHRFHYRPKDTVFYEGHASLGLYLLSRGKVKLTRSSSRGRRRIVSILVGGQLIEKHAFAQEATHLVTCVALEPCQVCLIEREGYLALVRREPALAVNLIRLLAGEVGMQGEEGDRFAFADARQRLAAALLDLGRRFGGTVDGAGAVRVGLPLTREEVGELAGVTMETAIRLLGAFRNQGLVAVDRRIITVLDVDRLTRVAARSLHGRERADRPLDGQGLLGAKIGAEG